MLVCFLVEKENMKQEDLHTLCFIFLALSLTVHDSVFSMIDILGYIDCNSPTYISDMYMSSSLEVWNTLLLFAKGSKFATKVPLV